MLLRLLAGSQDKELCLEQTNERANLLLPVIWNRYVVPSTGLSGAEGAGAPQMPPAVSQQRSLPGSFAVEDKSAQRFRVIESVETLRSTHPVSEVDVNETVRLDEFVIVVFA